LKYACRIAKSRRIHWCLETRSAAANGNVMRAEIQNIVDEIKQSVVLLRRHL
jgi:hypothetical protein